MGRSLVSCDCTAVHVRTVEQTRREMVSEEIIERGAAFVRYFADTTRLRIVAALAVRELCVCDLCALLDMTKSAVSHQLAKLRRARLVSSRRVGREIYYSLSDDHVKMIFEMVVKHTNEEGQCAQ